MPKAKLLADSEFHEQSTALGGFNRQKIGIRAVGIREMLVNFLFQLFEKLFSNRVGDFEIEINRHAIQPVNDTESRTAVHDPVVVFWMMIDEVENVILQLLYHHPEYNNWMMIDEVENVILQLLFERVTPCLGI